VPWLNTEDEIVLGEIDSHDPEALELEQLVK